MTLKFQSEANSKQAVRALRLALGLSIGDEYSADVRDAVVRFQRENGMTADGIAGVKTLAALAKSLPDARFGDYSGSAAVKAAQALVGAAIDGKFGKNTRANVIAFQISAGIEPTGNVDANTWRALWDCDDIRAVAPVQPVDYKQYDARWGKRPYTATGSASQTIASSGCGPTSMADILATWKDRSITPVEMCAYAVRHGYRTANSGTAWAFFQSVAEAYGFSKFVQTRSMATMRAALKSGALVVASMGPGYWTKGGHFICLWKTDEQYVYANDPASGARKKQALSPFEAQRKQFFIFYK